MKVSRHYPSRVSRRNCFAILTVLPTLCFLGGCTRSNFSLSVKDPAFAPANPARSWRETLQRVERSKLIGQTYDNALLAARRDNKESFMVACARLRRENMALYAVKLASGHAVGDAEHALQRAIQFQQLTLAAERSPSRLTSWYARLLYDFNFEGVPPAQWKAHTDKLYRRVLAMAPSFNSADPLKLNALGYYLAEYGRSQDDFKQAERLTRRSLEIWDAVLSQMSLDDERYPQLEYMRAQTSRDSLAWALFKQGRYTEALLQQERAVRDEARVASADLPRSADLHYHLGEIERALKLEERARRHYKEALKLDPQHAASLSALKSIAGSSP